MTSATQCGGSLLPRRRTDVATESDPDARHASPEATRSRLAFHVLMTLTALGVVLCGLVVSPLVPGLVWALSLAVVAFPLHEFIRRHVAWPSVAAGISVLLVTATLLLPTLYVAWQIGMQATDRISDLERMVESGAVQDALDRYPPLARLYEAVNGGGNLRPR
jgi:predicted PurR-regulated permease PerM